MRGAMAAVKLGMFEESVPLCCAMREESWGAVMESAAIRYGVIVTVDMGVMTENSFDTES